jgi:CubicO group peptidase (beta-lactamase class C family)
VAAPIPRWIRAAVASLPARIGPEDLDGLRAAIERYMEAQHIPGLAAAVVQGDRMEWAEGFGLANIAQNRVPTPETVFLLASISKTVTGAAVMQLVERGQCDLDADVNGYLPFPVRNPIAPDAPITARMLLTHTSSINDDPELLSRLYFHGDSPIELGDFMEAYLVPGGQYYSEESYLPFGPGEHWRYCNYEIFQPLGMTQTSWHLAGLHRRSLAMPYAYDWDTGGFDPYGHYGYPDYPDGLLRTSASQLATFLMAFIGDGELYGTRILEPATVQEMRRIQFPELAPWQGLIWFYETDNTGHVLLGHNGGDLGVATVMFYRPEDGVGVIVLTNGESYPQRIQDRIFAWATKQAPPTRVGSTAWRTRRQLRQS